MMDEQAQLKREARERREHNFAFLAVVLLVLALLLSPAACTMHRHAKVAEAIRAGADPILAKCAIEGDTGQQPICIARAQQVPISGK